MGVGDRCVECLKCRFQNLADSAYCENCGNSLRQKDSGSSVGRGHGSQEPISQGIHTGATSKLPLVACSNCKHDNISLAKFCEECGKGLYEACPKCERESIAGKKFCIECGVDINGHRQYLANARSAKECLKRYAYIDAIKYIESAVAFAPDDSELIEIKKEAIEKRDELAKLLACSAESFESEEFEECTILLEKARLLSPNSQEIQGILNEIPTKLRQREKKKFADRFEELIKSENADEAISWARSKVADLGMDFIRQFIARAEEIIESIDAQDQFDAAKEAFEANKLNASKILISSLTDKHPEDERYAKLNSEIDQARSTRRIKRFKMILILFPILGALYLGAVVYQSYEREKALYQSCRSASAPICYLEKYPDGWFANEAKASVDSLYSIWQRTRVYRMTDFRMAQESVLRFVWTELQKTAPATWPPPQITNANGQLRMSAGDYYSRYITIGSHGDADEDGFEEFAVLWKDGHIVENLADHQFGIVEFTPKGPRIDNWDVISTSFSSLLKGKFIDGSVVLSSWKIVHKTIHIPFTVRYSDDPSCCTRFRGELCLQFVKGVKAKVISKTLARRIGDTTDYVECVSDVWWM